MLFCAISQEMQIFPKFRSAFTLFSPANE